MSNMEKTLGVREGVKFYFKALSKIYHITTNGEVVTTSGQIADAKTICQMIAHPEKIISANRYPVIEEEIP